MAGLTDLIASGYRNARALSAAMCMFAAIGVMTTLKCQNAADPYLGTSQEIGLLTQVTEQIGEPAMQGAGERRSYLGLVLLADSTQVELMLPKPPPDIGDRIPLRCDRYESGKHRYTFDQQEWSIQGPR